MGLGGSRSVILPCATQDIIDAGHDQMHFVATSSSTDAGLDSVLDDSVVSSVVRKGSMWPSIHKLDQGFVLESGLNFSCSSPVMYSESYRHLQVVTR